MNLQILNPLDYPGWDELLATNENTSFFHTSAWARVLYETYHYKPLYFTSIDNGRLTALLPVMEVKSPWTGTRGISLPFTDYCRLIAPDHGSLQKIMHNLIRYGKGAGWRHVEVRNGKNSFPNATPSLLYYTHTLDLAQNEQELLSSFRSSTKRNIGRASNQGVAVEMYHSLNSIDEFYRLNCLTRKHHGLPPQPYHFFQKVYEHIVSRKKGCVVLASYQKRTIAGAIFFHFGEKAVFKYGASDRAYQHLRPNNVVMWEAIKWYAANDFKELHFGRTEPENQGLLQFKRGWGTREDIMNYCKYNFKTASFMKERSRLTGFHNKVFNITPIFVSRLVGALLYKHIA